MTTVTPKLAALAAGPVEDGIERAVAWLRSRQQDGGYWWAPMDTNVCIEAEYLMLMRFLGHEDPDQIAKMRRHILGTQRPDGSWATCFGGPPDLNCTVEAYFALKLTGSSPDNPPMRAAREVVLSLGGVPATRVFTRLWLALFGQYPWSDLPAMPPEAVLLPGWSPINIYAFACWARQAVVPILVVRTLEPVHTVPPDQAIPELYPAARRPQRSTGETGGILSARNLLSVVDRFLRFYEPRGPKPLRALALRRCEQYIVTHQEADGSWGGIQPPWVYSLIALTLLGHDLESPVVRKGIDGLQGYLVEEDGRLWMQACISPIWDTCLAMIGMLDCGVPPDDPAVGKAAAYLVDRQIRKPGDWQAQVSGVEPGGWAFEFANDWFPDTDDSAEVLLALDRARLPDDAGRLDAIERGDRWLLAMQSANGGWGAFDKDNTRRLVTQIPFADFGETIDPPSEDVTAHVIEYLGQRGYDRNFPPVARAITYLQSTQTIDGSWFGRWGVNHVYGTGAVLVGIAQVGEEPILPYIQRAVGWLKSVQNDDGGWGESCASYNDPSLKGVGPSTPSQTAWALLGLLAVGERESDAAARGVAYLVNNQRPDGTWDEDQYTGTGFPGDFYLNYRLYRHYWPMMALGRYRHGA
ncbi:MAG: squalene--hopene cyclase [Dehalococcoidia bacterium]|nr:squalene--hopene cyclase [Dehalococcoidia bacterium]